MEPTVEIINIQSEEEQERISKLLSDFEGNSQDGFLKISGTDYVFVIANSEADMKIRNEGGEQVYPLGSIESAGKVFSKYSVNPSFFSKPE